LSYACGSRLKGAKLSACPGRAYGPAHNYAIGAAVGAAVGVLTADVSHLTGYWPHVVIVVVAAAGGLLTPLAFGRK
jgi:hypothetical protein